MGASTTGPQRANLTHVEGIPVTSSSGKPYAVGTLAGLHGTVSFGSTETSHTASLVGLGASAIGEIELEFTGPFLITDDIGASWAISAEVTSTTVVTFRRHGLGGLSGACDPANLPASTHYFNARRKVLP